jgi:hypothetical protein
VNHLILIAVGSGDDADIDRDRPLVSRQFDHLLFQHPQQFYLGFQGQVADFIKKKRTAGRSLKTAGSPLMRPCRIRSSSLPGVRKKDEALDCACLV